MTELKGWFEEKLVQEFGFRSNYYLEIFCEIKETEKAAYIMFFTGFKGPAGKTPTRKCAWVPKSAIENIDKIRVINDYDEAVNKFMSEKLMYV